MNSIVKEEHGSRNGLFPQPLEPIAAVIHLFGNEPDLALATRAFSSSAMWPPRTLADMARKIEREGNNNNNNNNCNKTKQ